MSYIFISYNHNDSVYARNLADKLLHVGFDVWLDERNIDDGDVWWEAIVRGIRDCAAFVVLITPQAGKSKWVQREVMLADDLHKPIFPFLLEGDLHSAELWTMFIGKQYTDVSAGNLPPERFYMRLSRYIEPKDTIGIEVAEDFSQTPEVEVASEVPIEKSIPFKDSETNEATPYFLQLLNFIPQPFELCKIPAGKVTIDFSNERGSSSLNTSRPFSSSSGTYHGSVRAAFQKSQQKQPSTKTSRLSVQEFYISKYPITNTQYQAFVSAGDGYKDVRWWSYSPEAEEWRYSNIKPRSSAFRGNDLPRTNVNWYDAIAFCHWLSSKTGLSISLPTEKQWQRAAQGDDKRDYPWGKDFYSTRCNIANFFDEGKPTPVTRYETGSSPFGVLDMSGNTWEWCLNEYSDYRRFGLKGDEERVIRGGSFKDSPGAAKVTTRSRQDPDYMGQNLGFRIVCGLQSEVEDQF